LQDSATPTHDCKQLQLTIWPGKNEVHALILGRAEPSLREGPPTIVVAKWENEFDSSKAGTIQVGRAVDAPVAMASGD